jgi:hypothetical protein
MRTFNQYQGVREPLTRLLGGATVLPCVFPWPMNKIILILE